MSALQHAFESAGFKDVRTLLSSGNVVFEARSLFMTLIEKALGKEQTTRTWQTVEKAARSAIPT